MNEILSEIKPDIVEKVPSPYFKWIVLGTIMVVVLIIIYITFFQKKTGEKKEVLTETKQPDKIEKPEPFIEKNKEEKKEIFGEEKPAPTQEEAKKLTEDFNEESSEEVIN